MDGEIRVGQGWGRLPAVTDIDSCGFRWQNPDQHSPVFGLGSAEGSLEPCERQVGRLSRKGASWSWESGGRS